MCHPPLLPYFAEKAPWAVAAVELEEGPRMTTQLVGVEVDQYQIGMPLVVDFEDVDEDHTLVVFRPAASATFTKKGRDWSVLAMKLTSLGVRSHP